ncbi:uncharacterized protein LOC144433325 [Glandiceps talaboti]
MLPGLKNLPYYDRLRTLDLTTLKFRRLRGDLIEMFKIMTGVYDRRVTEGLFKISKLHQTRGHSIKVEKKCCRLEVRKNFFTQGWNNLPESAINATSMNNFKNRLDSFLDSQPMKYNIDEPYYM